MQRARGSGSVDEDMADGDLGDGPITKPRTDPVIQRSPSCSGLSSQGGSRRGSEMSWSPGVPWSYSQLHSMSRSGCMDELSKEELRETLQKATETIELLQTELEVAHRYLEGKYAALKILQGKAILEKATSHTKTLLQKSEQRSKSLEKEVNTLQWELSMSQLRLRMSEQSFEKNFYRMLSERNSLSEALKETKREKEQLQAENLALSQQYMDLLSRVSPQSIYPVTKTLERTEKDHSLPQGPDPKPPPQDNALPH
ncbi:coiled-coil domain-containing protein 125 isoform X1 [Periophthalmus magnuspinnatus]|uniref:coiled-coil domain-containing protein 125 isoform X1 n=1 Tax=Periophthalmus magnuspinnatus TaxID=409849 RepID=UPI00145B538C|nr:coiled-coil domain-containing protein 125 isoform X1 [Periophthalmus magnuspinnatus]XP_055080158.1 coiled-coil domain-containing protein 125 isoform X1 [Periophthalmus magnuspinnatus]